MTLADTRFTLRRALAEAKEEIARLQHTVETDPLTGLPNTVALERHAAAHPGGSYVLADLDGFKAENDTHGHDAGDMVLCEFADFLKATTRQDDRRNANRSPNPRPKDFLAFRLHGDEFAVYCPSLAEADAIAKRLREWCSQSGRVKTSAGIGETLKLADKAMYRDKGSKKNVRNNRHLLYRILCWDVRSWLGNIGRPMARDRSERPERNCQVCGDSDSAQNATGA